MNIRDDIRHLKTGDRDLRKFGLTVGGVFAVLGGLMLLRHKAHYPYCLWPGVALVSLGAVQSRALKWVYIAWMSVALALGYVMTNGILTLLFFLVITPVGLVARCVGKDFLSLKRDRAATSYWIPRERRTKSPADYERQF
jgi:hypothetical protein